MKIITSGTFFIAAAITDFSLTQTGAHNLFIGSAILQIIGLIVLIAGIIELFPNRNSNKPDTK